MTTSKPHLSEKSNPLVRYLCALEQSYKLTSDRAPKMPTKSQRFYTDTVRGYYLTKYPWLKAAWPHEVPPCRSKQKFAEACELMSRQLTSAYFAVEIGDTPTEGLKGALAQLADSHAYWNELSSASTEDKTRFYLRAETCEILTRRLLAAIPMDQLQEILK